jgi:hypothetical protein
MPNPHPDDRASKLRHSDEIDEIFGRANPNPTGEGCPPKDVLIALAGKERPVSDPAYVHLTRCSPCYLEVRALQESAALERRNRIAKLSLAAVLVLAIVSAVWFVLAGSIGAGPAVTAQLDLRPYALTRSDSQTDRQPLPLPRGRATLTLLLPVGSQAGTYEVQLLDPNLTSRASGSGSASVDNFVATLRTQLDLGSMAAGPYQLAIRRTGQEWQLFTARIQKPLHGNYMGDHRSISKERRKRSFVERCLLRCLILAARDLRTL